MTELPRPATGQAGTLRMTAVDWMHSGTDRFLAEVAQLSDSAFDEPSALPDWRRRHVVAHLARNAEALGRLLDWASTGVETPMYRDAVHRAGDIETSAQQPPDALRADVRQTAEALARKVDTHQAWDATVRSARGRVMPASDVPWMRTREVWLHTVDLGTGMTIAELPADLVDALFDDAIGFLSKQGCPDVTLQPTDRATTWTIGAGSEPTSGTASELLAWLLGRGTGAGLAGPRPALPAWL